MIFPWASVLAVAWALSAHAAEAREKPCGGPEYRQFDFWLGEWDVAWVSGKPAGVNRIRAVLGGCALEESWLGARGTLGTSLNYFDPVSRRWNQLWIDDTGLVLRLEGGIENGSMVLAGDARGEGGSAERHRITWTPLPEQRVRQHWQTSADGGATWRTVFDGIYVPRRRARGGRPPPGARRRNAAGRVHRGPLGVGSVRESRDEAPARFGGPAPRPVRGAASAGRARGR